MKRYPLYNTVVLERESILILTMVGSLFLGAAIIEHGWFKTSFWKRAALIISGWLVLVVCAYIAWSNDKPHLVIQSVDLQAQPKMKLGDKVGMYVYYKNDGAATASLRFANNMTFFDHLSSDPGNREKQATIAFTLAKQALDNPNALITPLTLNVGESVSGLYNGGLTIWPTRLFVPGRLLV